MSIAHQIYRVEAFAISAPYALRVEFDDQTQQTIDFKAVLGGELFGPLRELSLFNQVQIDPEVHALVWPNGADFDPETLHEWTRYAESLAARARRWESQPV